MKVDSNISAPTKFVQIGNERYAYRRFGSGSGLPLLFLQHFTGTLDNWDPAVTDPLAAGREVILSITQVSGDRQARCHKRSPAWLGTRWHSPMRWVSPKSTFLGSRLA